MVYLVFGWRYFSDSQPGTLLQAVLQVPGATWKDCRVTVKKKDISPQTCVYGWLIESLEKLISIYKALLVWVQTKKGQSWNFYNSLDICMFSLDLFGISDKKENCIAASDGLNDET